jgi:hypothetical protein
MLIFALGGALIFRFKAAAAVLAATAFLATGFAAARVASSGEKTLEVATRRARTMAIDFIFVRRMEVWVGLSRES